MPGLADSWPTVARPPPDSDLAADRGDRLGGGAHRIGTKLHRRGSGMPGPSAHDVPGTRHPEAARDGGHQPSARLQDRPLLDVEFERTRHGGQLGRRARRAAQRRTRSPRPPRWPSGREHLSDGQAPPATATRTRRMSPAVTVRSAPPPRPPNRRARQCGALARRRARPRAGSRAQRGRPGPRPANRRRAHNRCANQRSTVSGDAPSSTYQRLANASDAMRTPGTSSWASSSNRSRSPRHSAVHATRRPPLRPSSSRRRRSTALASISTTAVHGPASPARTLDRLWQDQP